MRKYYAVAFFFEIKTKQFAYIFVIVYYKYSA